MLTQPCSLHPLLETPPVNQVISFSLLTPSCPCCLWILGIEECPTLVAEKWTVWQRLEMSVCVCVRERERERRRMRGKACLLGVTMFPLNKVPL